MKISDLPLNKYKNVSCYNEKDGITIPDGFVKTNLTTSQLKMLGIETVKAHIGFEFRRIGGRFAPKISMPLLVNLIVIEDEPKANDYITKFEVKKKYRLSKNMFDWLFK